MADEFQNRPAINENALTYKPAALRTADLDLWFNDDLVLFFRHLFRPIRRNWA